MTKPIAAPVAEATGRPEVLVRMRRALGRLSRMRRQGCEFPLTFALRSVLFTIAERGEQPPTIGEIAQTERVTTPAISRSISRLERLGLVERIGDEVDQRRSRVRITDAGVSKQREVLRIGDAWFAERIDRLDDAEIALIVAALPAIERLCSADLVPQTPTS